MKLIDKHLLREFLIPVFYCLAGFALILIIGEISGDIHRLFKIKPPWYIIVMFYISALGPSMQYLAPASLMLGALYALYGLTNNNELTAMRASGISIYRIMIPFLAVGIVFSIGTAVLSETWIPHAEEWVAEMRKSKFESIKTKVIDQCIYLNKSQKRQWVVKNFDTKHPRVLKNIEVKQETDAGERDYIITAKKAEYLDGNWWFYNAEIQNFTNGNPLGKSKLIGLSPDSVVEMNQYSEEPSDFVSSVRDWRFLNLREMYHYLDVNKGLLTKRSLAEKQYGFHSRIAMPWACFIVILFAIPAGAKTGRQGAIFAVFTAIALLVGFYTLSQIGVIIGSTGLTPPWLGAWLANIVFCIIGLIMMVRIR